MSPSLKDLLTFAPVPGLDAVVTLLTATYNNIEKISVYRKQCEDMAGRCVELMLTLRDGTGGLDEERARRLADELNPILEKIKARTSEWADWGAAHCFFKQTELQDDLERLQKQLDAAIVRFGVAMNLELQRKLYESEANHHATRAEFREALQAILVDQGEIKKLLAMASPVTPQPVEQVMMHIQTELQDPTMPEEQHESFCKGLWELHSKTAKLPPLTDLTGQVELNSRHPEFIGTYNDVYIGTWLGKEQVAVRLPRTLADRRDAHEIFQREVSLWRTFDHPNVVPLYGIVYFGRYLYSVSPWATQGTAATFVEQHPQANVLKLLSEIAEGLAYLHSKDVVHGDLRGTNVLISKNYVAMLSDFGLSKFLEDCNKGLTSASSLNPRWIAPEILREKPLSKKSDIWSLGMTFLELLTGQRPYSHILHDINVSDAVKTYQLPKRPTGGAVIAAGLSEDMWKLLERCWKKPKDRPSVEEVQASLAQIRGGISKEPNPPRRRISALFTSGKKGSSSPRPGTSTSVSSEGSGSSNSGQLSMSLRGLSIHSIPEHHPSGSTLSPTSFAGPSPSSSRSSSSPLSSHSPVPHNRRPSYGGETQPRHPNRSTLSPTSYTRPLPSPPSPHSPPSSYTPVQPDRRPTYAGESPFAASFFTGSTMSFGSTVRGHADLTMEHPSAPRVELIHLEQPASSYEPRIRPRAATTSSNVYRATARSIVTVESVNQDPFIQEAISSKDVVVYVNQSGAVIGGTLEGLVGRLVHNFNLRKDEEFREVILTACVDLIETEDLLGMLLWRFTEAEQDTRRHPQDKMETQYNVFKVLDYWLSCRQIPVNSQLLLQMRSFCEEAIAMKVSPTMVDRAADLLDLVNERARQDSVPSALLTPGRRMLKPEEITPEGLAIAMTLLEGDKYKTIMPCDYLANQCGRPGFNRVDDAATTNNRIIQWIKQNLLHWDAVKPRAAVLKFYIATAQECRKLRNYHSLMAISIALGSTQVMSLELTKENLSHTQMSQYEEIVRLSDPESNFLQYRQAMREAPNPVYANFCIPWLAVHLKELHSVLHANKRAITMKGRPLINFQRYTLFMDKLKEVLSFPPPDLERFRQQGELAYLEDKLRNVQLTEDVDDWLVKKSRTIKADEDNPWSKKVYRASAVLGWNVSKSARSKITGEPMG